MELKTVLNFVLDLPGFVIGEIVLDRKAQALEINIEPRKGSKAICSHCHKSAPLYDTRGQRRFEHIPICGLKAYLLYTMRRVRCPNCGVKIEEIPWAQGKHTLTVMAARHPKS